jgi:Domain of unknown function (DUF1816)
MKYLMDWFKSESIYRLIAALFSNRQPSQPWWVEVQTSMPQCIYYFGPFDHHDEAKALQEGYIQDLQQEGARGIIALVKQCQPDVLTIDQGYYLATGQHH